MKTKSGPKHDVIVVGGGPVGLAAALGLQQVGAAVMVVGAVETPREDGRTAALMAPSVRFLQDLGAFARLEPMGHPLAAMRLLDLTGALVRAPTVTFRASEIGEPWFALNFANADLVREMTALFVERGGKSSTALVENATVDDDCSTLTLRSGERPSARLIVGADGQRSLLRTQAGLKTRSWNYDQTALTFHIRHSKDHEDISTELHLRAGPLTFVPFGDFRSAVVWLVRPDEAQRLRDLSPEALAIAVQRASSSLLGDLSVISSANTVPMLGQIAESATAARLALVGEALHAFPPIGAQGLNLGLRDARSIVRVVETALKAGRDPGLCETLSAYGADRNIDAMSRTYGVDLLNRSLFSGLLPLDLLRAGGLALAANVGPVRRMLMRAGMGENPLKRPA